MFIMIRTLKFKLPSQETDRLHRIKTFPEMVCRCYALLLLMLAVYFMLF